jgi:hypothetical protein
MTVIPPHFFSIYFVIGMIVLVAYAWQQFNKPSLQTQATLPRTVEPLRYLFLRSGYKRARYAYVLVSLVFYCFVVWPGPTIAPLLRVPGSELPGGNNVAAQAWALLAALILVGVVPNQKWLTAIEDFVRGGVHAWFLVPEGIVNTIAVLEDTSYEPPRDQLDAVANPARRNKLCDDLKLPVNTLQYRWARATTLMAILQQMRQPLKRSAFDPFQQDFEEIRTNYKALEWEIEQFEKGPTDAENEVDLIQQTESILKRIYAYISWGVRYQANTESEVDQILIGLGFRVPPTGDQRLFDIVAPAVLLVAAIVTVFWVISNLVTIFYLKTIPVEYLPQQILAAVSAGITAAFMYGSAIFIALRQRGNQIDQGVWREGSPTCLVSIVVWAGLVAWGAIAISTVMTQLGTAAESLKALWHIINSHDGTVPADANKWTKLPLTLLTPVAWILAGATVSVLLAMAVGRNITREAVRDRVRDTIVFGLALGIAAAASQIIQSSLNASLLPDQPFSLPQALLVGLVGAACGAIIGFLVPTKCRANLMKPADRIMAQALQDLLVQSEKTLGDRARAEAWVFEARSELGGITPAEAVQYKGRATSAWRLLDSASDGSGEDIRRSVAGRPAPVVIEGGRAGAQRNG